jgi:hypothetical protein
MTPTYETRPTALQGLTCDDAPTLWTTHPRTQRNPQQTATHTDDTPDRVATNRPLTCDNTRRH